MTKTKTPWNNFGTHNAIKNPCKRGCPDRAVGCHGWCEKYKLFCEKNEKLREEEKKWQNKKYW